MKADNRKYLLVSVFAVFTFLIIWEVCTDVLRLMPSNVMPSPVKVVQSFVFKLSHKSPEGATLLQHIGTSLRVALIGYLLGVLVGVPLGIFMGWYEKADMFIQPLFDLLRPMPPIAWIPVVIIFLGIGTTARATIIFLTSFIPCVLNSHAGIRQTKSVHIWVAQTFGASKFTILWKVAVPSALPQIFTGLMVSLSTSWSSLVAAELLASSRGLGYMIQANRMFGRPDIILVGMLTIGLIGEALSLVLSGLERILIKGERFR